MHLCASEDEILSSLALDFLSLILVVSPVEIALQRYSDFTTPLSYSV